MLDLQVQIRRAPKPVIAMVAGYAIGGGHVLQVCRDLTIAAENAVFGQTGPTVGSFDAGYGSWLLASGALNAVTDGAAGMQFPGDATMLYYMSEEAQEGRDACVGKRTPDFARFPRRP